GDPRLLKGSFSSNLLTFDACLIHAIIVGDLGITWSFANRDTCSANSLKAFVEEILAGDANIKTVKKEADISRSLNHPNIITFYGMFTQNMGSMSRSELGFSLPVSNQPKEEPLQEFLDMIFDFGDGHPYKNVNMSKFDNVGPSRKGSFGTVHSCTHTDSGIRVALKEILAGDANTKTVKKEADISRSLNHPNIITFYGMFTQNLSYYLCFELMDVDLFTLYTYIYRNNERLPENMIGVIAASMINGLVYLKKMNIIHRDIKPSNVLLDHHGKVKLCDFGVSGYLSRSVAKTRCGTYSYSAPELISSQDEYTVQADIWSLGITLYEIAEGKHPYNSSEENSYVVISRIINNDAPPELISSQDEYTVQADIWSLGITLYEIAEGKHPYNSSEENSYVVISRIINNDAPVLSDSYYSDDLCTFVNSCLIKDVKHRPRYTNKNDIRGIIELNFYSAYDTLSTILCSRSTSERCEEFSSKAFARTHG
ncbi:MAP kinase kinase mkk-4, partial [Toxocara canis]